MNMRLSRVEQTLRRALAEILLRGDLRDPRLRHAAAISITAVKISPDLGQAVVYVDVLRQGVREQVSLDEVLAGLRAGASALRAKLSGRLRLKRTPTLRFVEDRSIAQGRRIEAVLAEIHAPSEVKADADDDDDLEPDDHDLDDHDDHESEADDADEPEADGGR